MILPSRFSTSSLIAMRKGVDLAAYLHWPLETPPILQRFATQGSKCLENEHFKWPVARVQQPHRCSKLILWLQLSLNWNINDLQLLKNPALNYSSLSNIPLACCTAQSRRSTSKSCWSTPSEPCVTRTPNFQAFYLKLFVMPVNRHSQPIASTSPRNAFASTNERSRGHEEAR